MTILLELTNRKTIRAGIIARYMDSAGYAKCICFTCGNAAQALRNAGVRVLEVGPQGQLQAGRWWTPGQIAAVWPSFFDATSGHLPIYLMAELALALAGVLGTLDKGVAHKVPTGSGETILALRMAYPEIEFAPLYNIDRATRREEEAPLTGLVDHGTLTD